MLIFSAEAKQQDHPRRANPPPTMNKQFAFNPTSGAGIASELFVSMKIGFRFIGKSHVNLVELHRYRTRRTFDDRRARDDRSADDGKVCRLSASAG